MHLRRSTALATGALLAATPLLTGCGALTGKDNATGREYTPANGVNNRDTSVDLLGAVVVSGQEGSGTFVATLVNNDPREDAALTGLAGGPDDITVKAEEFEAIEVPARGLVNLADGQGVPVTGEFAAGQFVQVVVDLSTNESVTMRVPVVPDGGYFAGLDTSA